MAPLSPRSAQKEDADSTNDSKCRTKLRVLCYGDSLTAGFCSGGRRFEPYGQFLSSAMRSAGVECEVMICGLSGLTAKEMLDKLNSSAVEDIIGKTGRGLARFLDEDRPDLVVLMAGTNDFALEGPNAAAIFEHLRRLHDHLPSTRSTYRGHGTTRTEAIFLPQSAPGAELFACEMGTRNARSCSICGL